MPAFIGAQPQPSPLRSHYIIAFDRSIGNYKVYYQSPAILKEIDRILDSNGFNRQEDFLSVVGYTLEAGNPSMERFVMPYVSDQEATLWIHPGEKSLQEIFPSWPEGETTPDAASAPFGSMQSMAKPYAVMATSRDPRHEHQVDHTILLVVSDHVVNGIDDNYAQEWSNMSVIPGANIAKFREMAPDVFETLGKFNEEFNFIATPLSNGERESRRIPVSPNGVYSIVPYEVVSTERPSIHSVTDMPSPLPFKRVRNGYKLDIKPNAVNPKYKITDMRLSDARGNILGEGENGELDIFLPSSSIHEGDSLSLNMSLALNDGFYNATRMSGSNTRYHEGLTMKQPLRIQEEAKVLGILPLSDTFWWWFPEDIISAVIVWDIVIIVLFIILILCLGYRILKRIATYVPTDEKIKLKHL